jgi:hypothetical protein
MRGKATYQAEATRVIDVRIDQLRGLTFGEVGALPEASGEDIILGGTRCSVTVFSQRDAYNLPGAILVTVQVARKGFLGIASYHTERGLVFSPGGTVRDATALELQDSGG